jgi:hypothetical protein
MNTEYLYELRELHLSHARLNWARAAEAKANPSLTPRLRDAFAAFYKTYGDQERDLSELCEHEARRSCYPTEDAA